MSSNNVVSFEQSGPDKLSLWCMDKSHCFPASFSRGEKFYDCPFALLEDKTLSKEDLN